MPRLILIFLFLLPGFLPAQSYRKLHDKATVIDTHNDVLWSVIMQGKSMETDLTGQAHTDLERFRKGGLDVQVFSIFCDERFDHDTAFRYANIQIDSLQAIAARNPGKMMMVQTPEQLATAVREKKLGCMMGVEGGHMIEDKLENLEALYRRGVRYMTLTWNNSTSWASSAMDETTKKDSLPHKGLNDFGKQVVRKMNELGMLVDVSHVGEQTFWDAINTTTKPIIASHSCAHQLCPVFRNLNDDQIRAIGKNGGVIHLNFYSGFVDSGFTRRVNTFNQLHKAETDSLKKLALSNREVRLYMNQHYAAELIALRPPLSLLLDHLDHIVALTGVDHVGLGSDFDGVSSTPIGLDDVSTYPLITQALRQRGYSKKDIRKILGGNFVRVFKENQEGQW
jgi:membrane dipeptidase